MKNKSNIFWGIILILAAVVILAGGLGYLPFEISALKLVITVVLIAFSIASLLRMEFFGIIMPIAILGCMYASVLHIERITPWTLIIVALLLSFGLDALFGKHVHSSNTYRGGVGRDEENFVDGGSENGEVVEVGANFTGVIKYINSENFRRLILDNSFAGMKIYCDGAAIPSGQAVVDVRNRFGGIELYIPKTWHVNNQMSCSFGALEEKNAPAAESTATVTITGTTNFGGVTIIYV